MVDEEEMDRDYEVMVDGGSNSCVKVVPSNPDNVSIETRYVFLLNVS